ncbi:snare protein Snc2 [Obelidium mucronatum]|nr:snare protein Snc2 [Obelidium mucronatum]
MKDCRYIRDLCVCGSSGFSECFRPTSQSILIRRLSSSTAQVINVMNTNLSKVVQRGENLSEMQSKADNLQNEALLFKNNAREVRKKMWWKDVKMQLILAAIVAVILIIIIVSVVVTQKQNAIVTGTA